MAKTLGLALGAGGSRGISHIGFLQALTEEGIRADFVSGCSMGAIVGACYCAGIPMEEVKERVLALKLGKIASLNLNPIRANGLFNMNKARKILAEYIGEDRQIETLPTPFCCVATDIVSGKTIKMYEGNVLDNIIASSSIPGIFSPQTRGDMLLVDGGVLERVPSKELKKMGADVVVAVDVLGDLPACKPRPTNLIASILRYLDVIDTRITHHHRRNRSRTKTIDLWLEPDLGDMDQYQIKQAKFAYEKGYELGKANADNIRALIEE